jgi:1-acyl-sn-glycerol-3-phosphate acyltransferase
MSIQLDSSKSASNHSKLTKETNITSNVSPWFSFLAYPLARYVVLPFYFGRIEITGQENLPSSGPVILAPTHRSRWDSFMVPIAAGRDITGRDLRFMVTADEMKGIQGWLIRRFGCFAVDTKNPAIASIRHGIELLQAGEVLVIFPEGGELAENRQCAVNKLQPGLARIALQAESNQPNLGIQIVPINIQYSRCFPHRGSDVKIRIGRPLQVSDYRTQTESTKRKAERLTADLSSALRALQAYPGEAARGLLAGSA